MLKNKLSKFLVSVFALAVVFGALVFVSSGKVLADGDDGYIPDGFVLDEEDGWYKKKIDGRNCKLLNQVIINTRCGGGLPCEGSYVAGVSDDYFVAEDLVITKGISIDNGYSLNINLNGKTISYEPSDDELDVCLYRATPSEEKEHGNILYIYSTGTKGTVRSPKGAPLFAVGSCNGYRSCSVSIYDVDLEGNAQGYDPNGNRAITIEKCGDLTIQNCTISNFSAKQGGAIYVADFEYVADYDGKLYKRRALSLGYHTTIENCFADEGGAVYSEVSVDGYSATLTGNVAQTRGGAICVMGSDNSVKLNDCTITGNHCVTSAGATTGGGAIYCGSINTSQYAVTSDYNTEARVINNTCGNNVPNNIYFPNNSKYDIVFFDSNFNGNDDVMIGISRYSVSDMDFVAYANDSYTFSKATISQIVYDDPSYTLIGWEQTSSGECYKYLKVIKDDQSSDPIFLKGFSLLFHEYELKIKMSVYVPDLENYSSSDWSAELKAEEGSRFYVTKGALECEEVKLEDDVVYFTFTYDPTDMTVPLNFTVLRDNEQIITAGGFTVQDYALAILKNPQKYNEGDADIAATLVNYGACSQKYFKFRESDLADSILKNYPDLKEKIDNYDMETRFFDHDITFGITNRDGDITLYSVSAIFGGSPSVKLYFKVKDGVDPVFLYYDYDIDGFNQYAAKNKGNGVYTVTVPGHSLSYYAFDSSKLPDQLDFSYCYLNSSSTADLYLLNYLSYMYKNGSTAEMRELAKGLLVFQDVVISKTL